MMIHDYLKAGYPAILLLTQEPHRAESVLPCENWRFVTWDCLQGIRITGNHNVLDEIRDPVEAIHWLDSQQDTVLIAHNLHLFTDVPEVIQAIQNGVIRWKSCGCCLVVASPMISLRPEIEKLFHIVQLPFPNENELFRLQDDLARGINLQNENGEAVEVLTDFNAARAAKGLTEFEAETAFALSLVKRGKFSYEVISDAKSQMIRKSGSMEVWEAADISDMGGLENLKAYIVNRAKAFQPGNEHLPRPKGILLVGIPGTGKSLSCKATASILGWPLIRLDIGALKSSLVGESERNMRVATRILDAFGDCICWLDEVEKAFAGVQSSGQTDAGTTASMFGHFLTWLSETTTSVFVVATANNVNQLPPELLRAGRFDTIFFVDLPSLTERTEIIRIMNRKYNADIPESYAEQLGGFSGSEIEQLTKDSLFDGLETAANAIVPLSRAMREDVTALREWAKTRARLANSPEPDTKELRKIRTI